MAPTHFFDVLPDGGMREEIMWTPAEMLTRWREWVDAQAAPPLVDALPATPTRLPCDAYCDYPACVAARDARAGHAKEAQ